MRRQSKPAQMKEPASKDKIAGQNNTEKSSKKRSVRQPAIKRLANDGSCVFAPGLERIIRECATLSAVTENAVRNITFTIAPKTVCKESIQSQRGKLAQRSISDFRPDPDHAGKAAEFMRRAGFTIIRDGRFTITARGPAALVSDVMGISLAVQARPRPGAFRATQNFTVSYAPPHPKDIFVSPVHSLTVKATATASVDDFIFTPPPLFFAPPDPAPPPHAWSGIDQDGIRRLLQVPQQARGQGVKVGIVDTGFYRHPFYTSNGYDYRPTPTASAPHPEDDSDGHGTAIASNVFAMAPAASVYGFQQTDPPQDAVEEAASAGMDVISCSWGWDFEQSFMPLELAIRDIVAEGKIILFASGNGQQAWPGSMPEVLSIGGVFADDAGQLQASNFASGFISNRYPNRTVPDICGLCGQKPSAVYMMLPCPPGSSMDQFYAGAPYPQGDGTHADDGWVGASGTSSATPQLAGLVALLIEKARSQGKVLTLPAIRDILQRSGVAVQSGNNAQGLAAVGHPNGAVGFGLANAQAALALV